MNYKKILPILLCFFAMGFVDLVGIATNYVKADLQLSDTAANIFLVSDLFSSYRRLNEQNWTQEYRINQFGCHICFINAPCFW